MKTLILSLFLCLTGSVRGQALYESLLLLDPVVASGAPYSPADTANLAAWYKSDALVTNVSSVSPPTADDTIRTWGDSSGNGRHLTTNNPTAAAPVWKSAAQTGKGQGGLQSSSGAFLRVGFTAMADTTIFAVWNNASGGAFKIFVDSTNTASRQVLLKYNTDLFAISAITDATIAGAIPNPSWNILCGVFNSAGNDSVYTNGVVASTALTAGSQSLDGLTVLSAFNGTSGLGAGEYLGEVIIYNRNLNSTEIGQVNTYLNGRWSIY